MSDDATPQSSGSSWEAWGFAALLIVLATVIGIGARNFILARNVRAKNACIANLKQIDGAVQQWALEEKKAATDTYSLSDTTLLAYMRGSVLPVCPDHGRYLPGTNVAASPRCTIGGPGNTL
ncbi:MAG: hypothetical protein ACKODH_13480 [Limisphaerales bacterium]